MSLYSGMPSGCYRHTAGFLMESPLPSAKGGPLPSCQRTSSSQGSQAEQGKRCRPPSMVFLLVKIKCELGEPHQPAPRVRRFHVLLQGEQPPAGSFLHNTSFCQRPSVPYTPCSGGFVPSPPAIICALRFEPPAFRAPALPFRLRAPCLAQPAPPQSPPTPPGFAPPHGTST